MQNVMLAANLYSYCFNNPIMISDSTGYFSLEVTLADGLAGGVWNLVKFMATHRNYSNRDALKVFLKGFVTGSIIGSLSTLPGAIVAGLLGAILEVISYVGETLEIGEHQQ